MNKLGLCEMFRIKRDYEQIYKACDVKDATSHPLYNDDEENCDRLAANLIAFFNLCGV